VTLDLVDMLLIVVHLFIDMSVLTHHLVVSVVQKRGDALQHLRYPINRRNNVLEVDYDIYT
jgi:hypothetical protein